MRARWPHGAGAGARHEAGVSPQPTVRWGDVKRERQASQRAAFLTLALAGLAACASTSARSGGPSVRVHRIVLGNPEIQKTSASGDAPAMLIYGPAPEPPRWGPRLATVEVVDVNYCIDETGRARDVVPVSGREELLPISVDAVRRWRAKPALEGGKTVASCWTARFVFDHDEAYEPTALFHVAYERRPGLRSYVPEEERGRDFELSLPSVMPGALDTLATAGARRADHPDELWGRVDALSLHFCVDDQGVPHHVYAQPLSARGARSPYAEGLSRAARAWRFKASEGEHPVAACGYVEYFRVWVAPRDTAP